MTDTVAEPTPQQRIVTNRERLAGVVQSVGRRGPDIEPRRWESIGVFALGSIFNYLVGYWLVVQMHVVGFDTLDRLNRTLMIWHNDPPKLAALGFDYPPLATLMVSPLTLIPAVARSLAIVPLCSALFGGFILMLVNTMLRRADAIAPLRLAVLAALAVNPLFLLYAAGGSRQIIWLAFLMASMGALFAWYVTADIRFIMIAGLSYSVAALSGYSSLIWFLLSAIMIGAILSRLGADGTEVEGTAVGFAAPTVYAITLWTALNLLLLARPFAWITTSSDAASSGGLESFSVIELARYTGEMVFFGAPIAIVVLPALIFSGFARRNSFALWLSVLLAAAILLPPLAVVFRLTDAPMLLRNAVPILLLSVVGAIWLARSAGAGSMLVSLLLAVGLVISIPLTFQGMRVYKYQNLERPFTEAVATRQSQEGTLTKSRESVGVVDEEAMAQWIRDNVNQPNSILTDNAKTYAVMLFTGRPDLFFDRVDKSDGPWLEAAKDPANHVDYLLMSTRDGGDLLTELYPDAALGQDPLLTTVYATDRYVLVGIPPGYTRNADTATESSSGSSS